MNDRNDTYEARESAEALCAEEYTAETAVDPDTAAEEQAPESGKMRGLSIEADVLTQMNYAARHNKCRLVRSVTVRNVNQRPVENTELWVTSRSGLTLPLLRCIDLIPAGRSVELRDAEPETDAEEFLALTEAVSDTLVFSLKQGERVLAETRREVRFLPFDQWQGLGEGTELLCAYVTPNHPAVTALLGSVSGLMERWTGDPSLDGYQRGPERALKLAAAAYETVRAQQIVYCVAPPHFEDFGQRLRLCDEVLRDRMGNCIELTLLYNSLLELLGLHGLIVILEGHAFAGVWLEESSFASTSVDDPTQLTKRMADGLNELVPVECTLAARGRECTFDYACDKASGELSERAFVCAVDVFRTRGGGVKPLPQRLRGEDGRFFLSDYETAEADSEAPEKQILHPDDVRSTDSLSPEQLTELERRQYWERKLLDLGLRNALINLRLSGTVIPILTDSLHELENELSAETKNGDRAEFRLLQRPDEWQGEVSPETLHLKTDFAGLLKKEFAQKRLRSAMTENELGRAVKVLYRNARTAQEESGSNTLYLALGLLKWFEFPGSRKAHYAPLILVPVEIVRKSAAQGYVIRRTDDEAQINITILEKLEQDFHLTIEGLDPLPLDDSGIDTLKVFTIVRNAIMSEKNWDVLESAYLGQFSFSQFVMWNDLRNRAGDLSRNKVVKSLMQGKLAWEAEALTMPDKVDENALALPMSADASQLFAIQQAVAGKSFVLHGPPGTGKSQTITSLIACALAEKKTVLFVAEKMAALEVVQKRLEKIGIGAFCLELHSNKSRKRTVMDQLQRASEITKYASPEEYRVRADQLRGLREELSAYSEALHRAQSCGRTIFELINETEELSYAPVLDTVPEELIASITPESYSGQLLMLERLAAAGREAGHPAEHPLRFVRLPVYSQTLRTDVPKANAELKNAIARAIRTFRDYSDMSGEPVNTADELRRAAESCVVLTEWQKLPRSWSSSFQTEYCVNASGELADRKLNEASLRGKLLGRWSPDFLSLDGAALQREWREAEAKSFPLKQFAEAKLLRTVRPYMTVDTPKEELAEQLGLLAEFRKVQQGAEEALRRDSVALGELYIGERTDWNLVLANAKKAKSILNSVGADLRSRMGGANDAKPVLEEVLSAWAELFRAEKRFNYLLSPVPIEKNDNRLERLLDRCERLEENLGTLRSIVLFNGAAEEAEKQGLSAVVEAYREGMDHEDLIPAYRRAVAYRSAVRLIDAEPALRSFSGMSFRAKTEQLRKLDGEMMNLSRQEIYCRLAANSPDFAKVGAENSELGILQKAIRSGCRGMSLRSLFDKLPNLLPRLCPCMLMSPLSAAQYLDPKRKPFDIVVFDEASQLPTCKAVGVLARGENAVIVGDPKQMPPTTFFMTAITDEENREREDLESILEDCLALGMPESHLLWHYRSRHESLIAFSNRMFYENRLLTFPSVDDRERKVRLVLVDGCFDRGKTRRNTAEAEAVVQELRRRCHSETEAGMSVGVVTFNIMQQYLIEDLLQDACREDPALELWAYHSEEPLFIKNLENVQGDERDVILFSVGYGPDKEGKISVNFGPLNREGGWRRLNVAVSRARCEMIIYSTMTAEQIPVNRTSALGVAALRDFLSYAAGKPLPETAEEASAAQKQACAISESICEELRSRGLDADCLVGRSEYRIDVGVVDPKDPGTYCLGIVLDGEAYGKAQSVRDREIGRTGVLTSLGWKLHRVFALDWWEDREAVIDGIFDAIDAEPEPAAETESTEPAPIPLEKQVLRPHLYEQAEFAVKETQPEVFLRTSAGIRDKIEQVIAKEAPICESLLEERVLRSFGSLKNTGRVHDHLFGQFRVLKLRYSTAEDGKIYWRKDQEPAEYLLFRCNGEEGVKRDIAEIPLQEKANAMLYVLLDQVSLPAEPLARETGKQLGFARQTENIRTRIMKVTEYLLARGLIRMGDNEAFVLTDAGMERARRILDTMCR